jgi:hypothetical protein
LNLKLLGRVDVFNVFGSVSLVNGLQVSHALQVTTRSAEVECVHLAQEPFVARFEGCSGCFDPKVTV